MLHEGKVREGFKKAKDDVEGVKNELAFALRRIAKIEEVINQQMIKEISKSYKRKVSKKK